MESEKNIDTEDSGFAQPPSLNLPSGGGAIRGMGEKFAANPVTGTGSITVPIATSPGRSGFGPELTLSYNSGAGNGPFGFGWSLSLPSITRKTDKGLPRYRESDIPDTFILSNAEDLVPVVDDGQNKLLTTRRVDNKIYDIQYYRPRIEGLFARIECWTGRDDPEDMFWRSISRNNITSWYGRTSESRLHDPSDPGRIFSWLICQSHDDRGNAMVYQYRREDSLGVDIASIHEANRSENSRSSNRYLKRIVYGNIEPYFPQLIEDQPWPTSPAVVPSSDEKPWMFETVFDYGEHDADQPMPDDAGEWGCRLDPFSSYRAGFELRSYRLCQRVLMFHHFPDEETGSNCLVRSTDFSYEHQPNVDTSSRVIYSFLNSVSQTGYKKLPDGEYQRKSMPPLEFIYSQADISDSIETLDSQSLQNLPVGLDAAQYQWIDLDGTGLPGILTEQASGWFYKRNLGPGNTVTENGADMTLACFAPLEQISSKPSLAALSRGQQQLLDLAGDGQLDLALFEGPTPGFYERSDDEGWESFKNFESLPVLDWRNPNLKFVDLTGDGHADILISEDEAFTWHLSLAEAGFGPPEKVRRALDEEKGPKLVFADSTQSIYLADLSGDGLTDLVRIRNGEVCYWPNLGYARFGAKVTMDNAPWFDHPDQFNQQRIRLADIDGSGVTDIIYLGTDVVTVYLNLSGNAWDEGMQLKHFPHVDKLSSVMVVDLLGNGTACLVWSSPLPDDAGRPMRYIDLMGGQKPHLLVKTINNLGAETHLHYAPSTKFYLADKMAGKPWITRIPFPVHVVERVETYDRISRNRFVTRYAYHHGYFDGIEREFRGFGMVEQWDSEEYAVLEGNEACIAASNFNETSHTPPVHTRTWFHTGIYMGRRHVSNFFAGLLDVHDRGEYYREPAWLDDDDEASRHLLEDTILPDGLTPEEEREACRALKGSILRQEVYADDGTDRAAHPYSVTEQNFTVQLLQPRDDNRHAVFFAHPREAISYHYERNPLDPRITHTLTLEVDPFGNVLRSMAIGYGRRSGMSPLTDDDREKQEQMLITYTENDVTESIFDPAEYPDDYRTPLPCETRTYEITGIELPDDTLCFSYGLFTDNNFDALRTLSEIGYTETPDPTLRQKRLIEHERTLYRANDLSGPLDLGRMESLALPYEGYRLAFTPQLIARVYDERVSASILQNDGHYVHSEGDANWWIPSGQVFFSPDEADSPDEELENARQHFFTPTRYRDAFGHSEILYYDYDLLIRQTRDALQNTSTAENDFRVLQPWRMTDPNGNRTAAVFDALGLVVATAVMGKQDETDPDKTGDTLDDPTTRLEYELFAWRNHGQPNFVHSYAREQHGPENPRWQESYLYSDGFGRELQNKVQAEPGDAPQRGPASTNPYRPGALLRDENGQPRVAHSEQRWVGSGRTIYNNKGKPVKQYEPFFSSTSLYEDEAELVETGVTPILLYDPLERVVATLHPNHTYEKVVFDPWRQETWDVNDTVLQADPKDDPDVGGFFQRLPVEDYLPTWYAARIDGDMGAQEQDAAIKTEAHADTPGIAFLDTLGRAFLTIADNGLAEDGLEQKYETRVELDIEGNQRSVIDARGNTVMQVDYDMAGNLISQKSMDAGKSWILANVIGNPAYSWKMALDNETDNWQNERDLQFRNKYDALHRPVEVWVKNGAESEKLTDKTLYGETENDAESKNLRGKPFQTYDQAGLVENNEFDFKGNLLQSRRKLAHEYKQVVDWNVADPSALLQDEFFESRVEFDALNRVIKTFSPHNPQIPASEIIPAYNEANLLNEVRVKLRGSEQEKLYVKNIDYDAKGQRKRIRYGNDAITKYSYDPDTFRLTQLETTRGDSAILQNLHYTYDPVGNITEIRDDAQQTHYFNNDVVKPKAGYIYDAIYRLIEANGREHIGQNNPVGPHDTVRINHILPGDSNAMRRYRQHYEYDGVGNICKMIHDAGNGAFQHSWTRAYVYSQVNNRLLSTLVGNNTTPYGYDSHGNMTMPHLTMMQWDYKDQLQSTSRQQVNDSDCSPETTYYVYDASGQRIRKVIECHAGAGQYTRRSHERIYLGGFEIFRTYQKSGDTVDLERETLHIMDDQQRIGLVETRSKGDDGTPQQLVRYQFNNHLGSSSLELDEVARVISYEEYYPYGSSSYQAVDKEMKAAAKRYRYTGKERDDETGLYYYGARYYAAWLGRWVNCDPSPSSIFTNLYAYAANSPVVMYDSTGLQEEWGLLSQLKYKMTHAYIAVRFIMEIWGSVIRPGLHIVDIPKAPIRQPSEPVRQGRGIATNQQQAAKMGSRPPKVPEITGGKPPSLPESPVRLASHEEVRWQKAKQLGSRLPEDVKLNLEQLRKELPVRQTSKPTTGRVPGRPLETGGGTVGASERGSLFKRVTSESVSKVFAVGVLAADAAPLFLMSFSPYWCEAMGPWICGWSAEASIEMDKIRKEEEHKAFRKIREEQMVKAVGPETFGLIHLMVEIRREESQRAQKAGKPDPYPAMYKPAPPKRW